MTTAEQLLAEGETKGRAAALIEILTHRFGELDPEARTRIESADLDRLHTWTRRQWDATRLEDVFTD
ncbi:MAG: hypothetical protein QM809_02230 [Gordonia sp. (in: high G+C Gram-positive bacteria)]|uniref:hypothetical protein n=1 Tax=Gordonia sp. (in: high G+C Gram-positive bacteria) TaxID=84139 RepID=UPI0039E6F4CD